MTGRAAGRGCLFVVALGAPLAIIVFVDGAPDEAATVIVVFAAIGAAGGAFSGAIEAIGGATGRPARALGAFAALSFGAVALSVAALPELSEEEATFILFLCLLPLLNAAADFASTGLTRWWLRQGLRGNLVGHALRDAGAALGILAALGFGLIATIRWVRPRDGTPLLDLAATFADLRANPGDYYWLYFCFFSTLLPTVLHLSAACFGLFTLASKRLGRPIAELLQAGATDSVKAKDGVVALSLCVSAALLAPFAALYGLFAVAGRPILFALLDLFEAWARLIDAI